MLLNEAVFKTKTTYDRTVDRFGTEKEYGTDISSFIIYDVIRTWQLFHIAIKYIKQNRQNFTVFSLIKSAFDNIITFSDCFSCYSVKTNTNNIEIRYYIYDVLNVISEKLNNNNVLQESQVNVYVDERSFCFNCKLLFKDILKNNIDLFKEICLSMNKSKNLRFYFKLTNNEIYVYSKDKNKQLGMICNNFIEVIYHM